MQPYLFTQEGRRQSFPILYYLLDGSRSLVDNMSTSVLSLFKFLLRQPDEDLTDIRKLISMCAMLLAHLDMQVRLGFQSLGRFHPPAGSITRTPNISYRRDKTGIEIIALLFYNGKNIPGT